MDNYTPEQRREYMIRWRERRISEAKASLGGHCATCNGVNDLEFHHIDPTTKLFSIMGKWWIRHDLFLAEVAKCQLLCKPCHIKKTRELAFGYEELQHGTVPMYRTGKCRCRECVSANSKRKQEWRARTGRR